MKSNFLGIYFGILNYNWYNLDELLYFWGLSSYQLTPITDGLINETYRVIPEDASESGSFILQRINQDVFQHPEDLMSNYHTIAQHLRIKEFPLAGPIWLPTTHGVEIRKFDGGYWRLGNFYENTQSFEIAKDTDMAWRIGRAFGQYDKDLLDLPNHSLTDTIDNFHSLQRYLDKLTTTIKNASPDRLVIAKKLIDAIDTYIFLTKLPFPKNRVIHNDAKASNLLFQKGDVYAIIDWDTTMAGHISWEYADLFRTTVVNVPEDHPRLEDLRIQYDMMDGLHTGYKSTLFDHLSSDEKDSFFHGALYLIFEQAIRFLEDYLAGDQYYKCNYDDHNYIRARNQFYLLTLMIKDKKTVISSIQRS